jgi:hypothetical protein
MTFLSQPTDALVQTRAELILLGNRNRASRIKEIEENRLRGIIFGNMIGNLPEPELISFIDPEF